MSDGMSLLENVNVRNCTNEDEIGSEFTDLSIFICSIRLYEDFNVLKIVLECLAGD